MNSRRDDRRTDKQLAFHYEQEKALANRLRTASAADRRRLYTRVYDEFYAGVPQVRLTEQAAARDRHRAEQLYDRLLGPLLSRTSVLLEIGPGDCSATSHLAPAVAKVYSVDASAEIAGRSALPQNVELLIADGSDIPLPSGAVDVAFSSQLFEHLHPDDAALHLRSVLRSLRPGGAYVCVTPNRLNGPHDISAYFDDVATGFHLKEYTTRELAAAFESAGFRKVRLQLGLRGRFCAMPCMLPFALERLLLALPTRTRRVVASYPLVRQVLGIVLLGIK